MRRRSFALYVSVSNALRQNTRQPSSSSLRSSSTTIPSQARRHLSSLTRRFASDIAYSSYDPYTAGATLQLLFKPENTPTSQTIPLTVTIVKPFIPFTWAVALLVKPCTYNYIPHLPPQFVVKLCDRRFGHRSPEHPDLSWTPDVESSLYQGVREILSGARPNFFRKIGLPVSKEERDYDEWPDWMWEINCWEIKDRCYRKEVTAYRHLVCLQGTSIPRFYGTVQLCIAPPGRPPLHAVTDVVDGIVLEYIPGTTLEELQVGSDVSPALAEEISQKALRGIRQVRDLDTIHGDVRLGNIILRGWPNSSSGSAVEPEPVLIDFGFAHIRAPDGSGWVPGREVNHLRWLLNSKPETGLPWHPLRSPYAQEVLEEYAKALGYGWQNEEIEGMPDRDALFERVPGTGKEGRQGKGKEEVLRWRVRPGVRTRLHADD